MENIGNYPGLSGKEGISGVFSSGSPVKGGHPAYRKHPENTILNNHLSSYKYI